MRRDGEGHGTILSNVVLGQWQAHAPYGGVVPEIAARAHGEAMDEVVREALRGADASLDDIHAVAATSGPGLVGGLLVGSVTGRAIAAARGLPFLAINHLEGHALTARLTDGIPFPYLLLLVSGGHSQFIDVRGVGDYRRVASTIDDAVGEAFDKAAKLLGLGYPGGPAVEREAARGDGERFDLPRPLSGGDSLDMSFSGLKTAVRIAAERSAPLDDQDVADLCASFQAAVVDVLADRTRRALERTAARTFVAAGGVAANSAIRATLEGVCLERGARFIAPPRELCGDNAAMIAWAGAERLALGRCDGLDAPIRPRWPLDEHADPLYGSGRLGAKV